MAGKDTQFRGRQGTMAAWLAVTALLVACWWLGFSPNADPDDVLKLEKIRAFLATLAWFDQSVPGILQPEPFHSHWPRLLDLPYAVPALLLEPLVGREAALRIVTLAVPPLLALPAIAFFRGIVAELGFARPGAAFALAMIPALRAFFEFAPGRIDYHNVEIVLLLAVIALSLRPSAAAALTGGLLVALALSTSIEFLLFFAVAGAVHAYDFVLEREGSAIRLGLFGTGLAAGALLAFPLVVPPDRYGEIACDSFSLSHLSATVLAGGVLITASLIRGRPPLRAAMVGGGGLAAVLLMAAMSLQCLSGPYAGLGPYLRAEWLGQIAQELSLFSRQDFVHSLDMVGAALLLTGAVAPAAASALSGNRPRGLTVFGLYALLAAALAVLYFRYFRYLPLLAAPGLLVAIAALVPGLRKEGALLANRVFDGLDTPAVIVAPGLAGSVALVLYHLAVPSAPEEPPAAALAESCAADISGGLVVWPEGARILSPPLVGMGLLQALSAQGAVVAVPFHTGAPGLERVYRFLDEATADRRAVLDASGATHVVLCPWPDGVSLDISDRYRFVSSLMTGNPPDWLVECPSTGGVLRVYRYPAAGSSAAACPVAAR